MVLSHVDTGQSYRAICTQVGVLSMYYFSLTTRTGPTKLSPVVRDEGEVDLRWLRYNAVPVMKSFGWPISIQNPSTRRGNDNG